MNFALAHVLGATLQTALFNASLVVIVGWGLGKKMVSCFPDSCQAIDTWTQPLTSSGLKIRDFRRCPSDLRYHCCG